LAPSDSLTRRVDPVLLVLLAVGAVYALVDAARPLAMIDEHW
jgi:hypothetical protein